MSSSTPIDEDEKPQPKVDVQPRPQTWKERWIPRLKLMAGLFLPVFLETLDYTVVATAQTEIASMFGRLDIQSYIGTVYVLTSTVFLPVFASIADIFGRYWAMQLGVFCFMVGSAISTGANSMPVLLVGRGIAGIGAAALLTVVRIILADSTNLDDNNVQAGLLSILYAVGYSVGPVIGGALVSTSWRWVFAINLPCCAASIVLIFLFLRNNTKGAQPPRRLTYLPPSLAEQLLSKHKGSMISDFLRIDTIGACLFVASGILLLLALSWGSTERWNQAKVIACFVAGGVLLFLFIAWEWMVEHATDHLVHEHKGDQENGDKATPTLGLRQRMARAVAPKWAYTTDAMIPMNIFRSFDVVATNFAAFVSGMIMLGIFYFVSVQYVIVDGKSATHAGVSLLYFAPGMGAGVFISMRMLAWFRQPKYPIVLSQTLIPVSIGLLSKALSEDNQTLIAVFMALCGAGVGMGFAPLSIHARFSQAEDRIAIIVASNLFFRTAGGTVGLAQLAAVMNAKVRSYITSAIYSGALSLSDIQVIGLGFDSLQSIGGINNLPLGVQTVVKDAFKNGLKWAFISLIPWCVIAWLSVLFLSMIPREKLEKKPGSA